MINALEKKNNIDKVKNIKSNLLYGTMDKKADFSIVIPIHGNKKFLKDVLMNLSHQDASNLKVQIIISNDLPEEEVNADVISMLEKIDSKNIAYFSSEKALGQVNNFNRSLFLAETEYIGMIHDDDLVVKNYYLIVERLLRKLKSVPQQIGMVHARLKIFYDNCEIMQSNCRSICRITNYTITQSGTTTTGLTSCGTIFNREAFIKAGGFNDEFPCSGDAFLAGVMIDCGYKIYQFEDLTGYYRISRNFSLKLSNCQGFIYEDEIFRDSWKRRNSLRSLYMTFFKNYYYSTNIDGKVNTFSKVNHEITVDSLDYKKTYKKYHKYGIMHILFKLNYILRRLQQKFFVIDF